MDTRGLHCDSSSDGLNLLGKCGANITHNILYIKIRKYVYQIYNLYLISIEINNSIIPCVIYNTLRYLYNMVMFIVFLE